MTEGGESKSFFCTLLARHSVPSAAGSSFEEQYPSGFSQNKFIHIFCDGQTKKLDKRKNLNNSTDSADDDF